MRELDNREKALRQLEELEDLGTLSTQVLVDVRQFILYINPIFFMDEPTLEIMQGTGIRIGWLDIVKGFFIHFEFSNSEIICEKGCVQQEGWTLEGQPITVPTTSLCDKFLLEYYDAKRGGA